MLHDCLEPSQQQAAACHTTQHQASNTSCQKQQQQQQEAHLERRRGGACHVEHSLQPLQTVTCREQAAPTILTSEELLLAQHRQPARYERVWQTVARRSKAAPTALHSKGAAVSDVGVAGELPRCRAGRLVALLVLLPLPLHGQARRQLAAVRVQRGWHDAAAAVLPANHLHPVRVLRKRLVHCQAQGLGLAGAATPRRLEAAKAKVHKERRRRLLVSLSPANRCLHLPPIDCGGHELAQGLAVTEEEGLQAVR